LPALLDPLAALAHLPRRQLNETELAGWRCGRALAAGQELAAEQPVAVLAPDGNLAGMARASGTGLLQPKLVFNATG
jgi:tRNA pseudouridine55 synthase